MKLTATDLQEIAFRGALTAGNIKPEWIDSVVVGNVFPVSADMLIVWERLCFGVV